MTSQDPTNRPWHLADGGIVYDANDTNHQNPYGIVGYRDDGDGYQAFGFTPPTEPGVFKQLGAFDDLDSAGTKIWNWHKSQPEQLDMWGGEME